MENTLKAEPRNLGDIVKQLEMMVAGLEQKVYNPKPEVGSQEGAPSPISKVSDYINRLELVRNRMAQVIEQLPL